MIELPLIADRRAIISCADNEIHLGPLTEGDIPEIADMYQAIHITGMNYREKFEYGNPAAFKNTGGMFIIWDEAQLRRILHTPGELVVSARLSTGELIGSLWYSAMDPHFDTGTRINYVPEYEWLAAVLTPQNDRLVYSRELVASPKCAVRGVALYMYAYYQRLMLEQGYDRTLFEIYRLIDYSDSTGTHRLNMLNERSFNAIRSISGVRIGTHSRFKITQFGYTVAIEPQVMMFDNAASVAFMEKKLAARGGKIFWEAINA